MLNKWKNISLLLIFFMPYIGYEFIISLKKDNISKRINNDSVLLNESIDRFDNSVRYIIPESGIDYVVFLEMRKTILHSKNNIEYNRLILDIKNKYKYVDTNNFRYIYDVMMLHKEDVFISINKYNSSIAEYNKLENIYLFKTNQKDYYKIY